MKYFSKTNIVDGSYPVRGYAGQVREIVNFSYPTYCPEIGGRAMGYIDYRVELRPSRAAEYGLIRERRPGHVH